MRLLEKRNREAGEKYKAARFQVDMALLKMDKVLDDLQEQVAKAKEEIGERRTG